MERTSIYDIRRLVDRVSDLAAHLLEGEHAHDVSGAPRFILEEGSATYGRCYRLVATGGTKYGTGHWDPIGLGSGYLGHTKREAFLTLRGLVNGLQMGRKAAGK